LRCADIDSSKLIGRLISVLGQDELRAFTNSPNVAWRLLEIDNERTIKGICAEALSFLEEDSFLLVDSELVPVGCSRIQGLIVDFASSYDCPSRGPKGERLERLNNSEANEALNVVSQSLDLLKEWRQDVLRFVHIVTNVVVLRADKDRSKGFTSSSFRHHAGLTLLANPHIALCDPLKILDSLVHEAIHALIYLYEPLNSDLCSIRPRDFRIASPWSGRALNVDQYVQACFVWWGLLNLWRGWRGPFSDRANQLLERAELGFKDHPVTSLLKHAGSSWLTRDATLALLEIERLAER
jgi:hypothetical protein